MHYKLTVTGGFAGMAQNYEGNLSLPEQDEKKLTQILKKTGGMPGSKNLRDSFYYDLTIKTREETIQGKFDDLNTPPEVSQFISKIRTLQKHRGDPD